MKLVVFLLTLGMLATLGCSGGKQASDEAAPPAETSAKVPVPSGSAEPAPAAEAAATEGVEVTLAGTLGCGHCNYHVGSSCSAAVKTADGKIYILDVDEDSELFTQRQSGKAVTVVGMSRAGSEGVNHLDVASYELD
jgi:hypothetical protein